MTKTSISLFAAATVIAAAATLTPALAAMTQQQAVAACKQEMRNTWMQRNRTGQSPNDAMRQCVRQKMGK